MSEGTQTVDEIRSVEVVIGMITQVDKEIQEGSSRTRYQPLYRKRSTLMEMLLDSSRKEVTQSTFMTDKRKAFIEAVDAVDAAETKIAEASPRANYTQLYALRTLKLEQLLEAARNGVS